MAHTPGPWAAYPPEFSGDGCWTVQDDAGLTVTVECPDSNGIPGIPVGWDTAENRQVAHLIAAAPDLLAALIECRDCLVAIWDSNTLGPTSRQLLATATAAIDKAQEKIT